MLIRYPKPLQIGNLRQQGFDVVKGRCLKSNEKHVSANRQERAAEFLRFWRDQKWFSGFSELSPLMLPLTAISRAETASNILPH